MKTLNRKANYYAFFSQQVWALHFLKKRLWSCLEGHGNLEVNVSSLLTLQYSCHEIFQTDSTGETRTSLFRSFSGGNLPDFLSFFFKLRYRWSTILCFSTWRFLGKDTGMGSHSFLPGCCSDPGIKPGSPALQADSLPTIWATREPWLQVYSKVIQLYILF